MVRAVNDDGEVVLGDCTGSVAALVPLESRGLCVTGAVVFVTGRYRGKLIAETVRAAEPDEYREEDLRDGPTRAPAQMEADLRELLATIQNPHLRRLLSVVFGEGSPTWAIYREAPAAKRYHQAYRHGLLEHCLTVAQSVSAISATFPGIDRDVAVTGALLHDIGKLEAYEVNRGAISMSDHGRLYGEIPLGYYTVRRAIEDLDGFPPSSSARCSTSSSATTARSSTAARSSPARVRPPSCT